MTDTRPRQLDTDTLRGDEKPQTSVKGDKKHGHRPLPVWEDLEDTNWSGELFVIEKLEF